MGTQTSTAGVGNANADGITPATVCGASPMVIPRPTTDSGAALTEAASRVLTTARGSPAESGGATPAAAGTPSTSKKRSVTVATRAMRAGPAPRTLRSRVS